MTFTTAINREVSGRKIVKRFQPTIYFPDGRYFSAGSARTQTMPNKFNDALIAV